MAINAVLNPVTALFRVKNGEAVQNEPLIKLKELVEVCYPFFEKRNLFTSESEYLDLVIEVAGKTAENINSMLTDIISDRETEVNEILVPIQQEINSPVLQGTIDKLND